MKAPIARTLLFVLMVTLPALAYAQSDPAPPAMTVRIGTAIQWQTVDLRATATNARAPVTFQWEFGDGTSGTGETVRHAYPRTGAYTVTVTATDAGGATATDTWPIHVTYAPEVSAWSGADFQVRGRAASCSNSDPATPPVTATLVSFDGTISTTDRTTLRTSATTGVWDHVVASGVRRSSCPGDATGYDVELDGPNEGTPLVAIRHDDPPSPRSAARGFGPGAVSLDGTTIGCAINATSSAIVLLDYRGKLTGRDLTTDRDETIEGEWSYLVAFPVPAGTSCMGGRIRTDIARGYAVIVAVPDQPLGTPALSTPPPPARPSALPSTHDDLPTWLSLWGGGPYAVRGTGGRCSTTDSQGDAHVQVTMVVLDVDGNVRGSGDPTGQTGHWDLLVAHAPTEGHCGGGVEIDGPPQRDLGILVGMNLSREITRPPTITPLGPGTSFRVEGTAQACRRDGDAISIAGFKGTLTGRDTAVPSRELPARGTVTTKTGEWDLVIARDVASASCTTAGVLVTGPTEGFSPDGILVGIRFAAEDAQGSPSTPTRPPATPPQPTARTPCYDLLSCPIGDVSALRSRILGVRGQVKTAAGIAVAGAPVLLLGERDGALDLLSITQSLEDGSFSVPTTAADPAYAATVLGGHVVLADLAARGGVPSDGLLSLDLPVPDAAAGAKHAQLTQPELQLLADAFNTAKPFGVPQAAPGAPGNVPLGGYAGIRGVGVHPTLPVSDARVVVVEMKDKGSPRIPDPPGASNPRYFAVQVADENGTEVPLSRMEFEFEAPEGSEGKDVFLHHFLLREQRWETLKAQRTPAGTYAAAVDSLSLFAVSTTQPSTLAAVVTSVADSPLTLPVVGGLVVVGIAVVAAGRARATLRGKRATAAPAAALRAAPLPEREALVADLSVSAKGTSILQGVSFAFAQGEILALLGPSGSGKSTLLKALLGEAAYTGEVSLFGIDPSRAQASHKKLIGYVSQETELYPDMTLAENVEYFGRQYGLSSQELKARVGPLLETLGLTERAGTRVGLLSGGQQRRASIAATLVHGPSLLVLDEPTSGLDPVTRKSLWKFVRQASRELGVTVIVTTHFLDEADLADRVVILNKGRVVRAGTPQELVRSLPGGGKAVVLELQSTSPAIEARVRQAVAPLASAGVVSGADLSGYTARFFTANAQAATRELLDVLARAEVPVKQVTTEDCGMDAVFSYYAGERWRDEEA